MTADDRRRTADKFRWLDQVGADPALIPLCFRVAYAITALVNSATGDAWPGQNRLAADCHVSDRTIRRVVELLQKRGHLEVTVGGGRAETNRYRPILKPSETRTHVSTLRAGNVDIGVQDNSEKHGHVRPETRTYVSGEGGHPCPTIPLRDPIKETSKGKTLAMVDHGFDEFWAIFPKKVDKLKAEKLYAVIIKTKRATAADLLAGAKRYAAAKAGTERRFIKHPTTWLNAGAWLDEIEPNSPTPTNRADSAIAGMRRFLEQEPSQ
jgi:hypothetical protein